MSIHVVPQVTLAPGEDPPKCSWCGLDLDVGQELRFDPRPADPAHPQGVRVLHVACAGHAYNAEKAEAAQRRQCSDDDLKKAIIAVVEAHRTSSNVSKNMLLTALGSLEDAAIAAGYVKTRYRRDTKPTLTAPIHR